MIRPEELEHRHDYWLQGQRRRVVIWRGAPVAYWETHPAVHLGVLILRWVDGSQMTRRTYSAPEDTLQTLTEWIVETVSRALNDAQDVDWRPAETLPEDWYAG